MARQSGLERLRASRAELHEKAHGWSHGSIASLRAGLDGVMDALLSAQHVLEMFRRALPNGASRTCLTRLSNRLTKIVQKHANSLHPENGQRLAGYADKLEAMLGDAVGRASSPRVGGRQQVS